MNEKKHSVEELRRLQQLSLDEKIHITETRILEFYHKMNGKMYVAFSGGKDSTVLLHIVRNLFPDTEAVFSDTGLEFPELKEFVKTFDNVTIIRPKKDFRTVIMDHGYPVISKQVVDAVYYAKRSPNSQRAKNLRGEIFGKDSGSKFGMSKYEYLLNAPFEVNNKCCDIFKKKPMIEFGKKSGKSAIIGTLAEESMLREKNWVANGCNVWTKGKEKSFPMSIWTEKDVWEYIARYNIKIAKPYSMGYKRTGCIFCAFGAHLEKSPNRFDMLRKTHPHLYEYMMKPKEEGGLGFKPVLEYVGIKEADSIQNNLFDYIDEDGNIIGENDDE